LKEKDLEKVQELVETVFYHFVVGDGAFWTGCRVFDMFVGRKIKGASYGQNNSCP